MITRAFGTALYLVLWGMLGFAVVGRPAAERVPNLYERAMAGEALAQYSIGRKLILNENDTEKARTEGIPLLEKAAAQGEVHAEGLLCWVWGMRGSPFYDRLKAEPYCEAATAKGNAAGMVGLADLLESSKTKDRDLRVQELRKARQLYAEAAAKGVRLAMYKHGQNLYRGKFGDKSESSRAEGMLLLERAAAAGLYPAAEELVTINGLQAIDAQSAQEEERALQKMAMWLSKARQINGKQAAAFIARKAAACRGSVAIYVPLSHTCHIAARAGDVTAQVALARILSYEPDKEKNIQQALYWARAAALQRAADGQYLLADILGTQERQSAGALDHSAERYSWYVVASENNQLSGFKRIAAKNYAKELWKKMDETQRKEATELVKVNGAFTIMPEQE